MDFKKAELGDLPVLREYFKDQYFYNSGYTATMLYLWTPFYNTEYAVIDDMILCRSGKDKIRYSFPIGQGDKKRVLDQAIQECKERGEDFEMYGVTKDIEKEMKEMYGDTFDVVYDRDEADYVYLSEKLISLSGKKLHGKRNHINRFVENHEWSYEEMTDDNTQECLDMLKEWGVHNIEEADQGKNEEICVARECIIHRKELGLKGGLIRCEGAIIAFSMGEPLNKDTFVVHIEKAFSHIQGAYPIINQQFVKHEASEFTYINREEDCGEEGLRKAKLSYRPETMIEKGILKFH